MIGDFYGVIDRAFPKKEHRFAPCRFANTRLPQFEGRKDIDSGWVETSAGTYKPVDSLPYGVTGLWIIDGTLYLESLDGSHGNLVTVATVPDSVKKISREKWLKSVALTLIDDPHNVGNYIHSIAATVIEVIAPVIGTELRLMAAQRDARRSAAAHKAWATRRAQAVTA